MKKKSKSEVPSSLRLYLRELSKIPPITEEEEKQLRERIKKGDKEALKRLIEGNLRFVVNYAKRFLGYGLSYEDLINEGNLGLIEAAARFDPDKNVKFLSYAIWWIRQAILHALSQNSRAVLIPKRMQDKVSKVLKTKQRLEQELQREVNVEEIADQLEMDPQEVAELLAVAQEDISLSQYDEDEEGTALQEQLGEEDSTIKEFLQRSLRRKIEEVLKTLSEKEAQVIRLRYGLDDDEPKTLDEIGKIMGISRERVRQIEKKALKKLRMNKTLNALRGYLN